MQDSFARGRTQPLGQARARNDTDILVVYKIPYRRVRAWPGGCIGRVRARAKESCIQALGPSARLVDFVCPMHRRSSAHASKGILHKTSLYIFITILALAEVIAILLVKNQRLCVIILFDI